MFLPPCLVVCRSCLGGVSVMFRGCLGHWWCLGHGLVLPRYIHLLWLHCFLQVCVWTMGLHFNMSCFLKVVLDIPYVKNNRATRAQSIRQILVDALLLGLSAGLIGSPVYMIFFIQARKWLCILLYYAQILTRFDTFRKTAGCALEFGSLAFASWCQETLLSIQSLLASNTGFATSTPGSWCSGNCSTRVEAMIGGVIWCSGNCLTVYIIQQIGLGPGAN